LNLVVLHAVLRNGIEYPLFYKVWRKPAVKGDGPTKLDLAKDMLLALRQSTVCRVGQSIRLGYQSQAEYVFIP
jgi:hypothetical protein